MMNPFLLDLIDEFSCGDIFVYDEDLFQRLFLDSNHRDIHFLRREVIIVS